VEEKRVAKNLDKLFADNRLNPVQLAHLTARMMNDKTNAAVTEWYSWHVDLQIQQEYPDQCLLDLEF
jgi:hypothetical protein